MKNKKRCPTKKLMPVDAIGDIEEIIAAGFDLYNSIKNANWKYNDGKGLPHKTDHMNIASDNWFRLMKNFNRHLGNIKRDQDSFEKSMMVSIYTTIKMVSIYTKRGPA